MTVKRHYYIVEAMFMSMPNRSPWDLAMQIENTRIKIEQFMHIICYVGKSMLGWFRPLWNHEWLKKILCTAPLLQVRWSWIHEPVQRLCHQFLPKPLFVIVLAYLQKKVVLNVCKLEIRRVLRLGIRCMCSPRIGQGWIRGSIRSGSWVDFLNNCY